MGLLDQKVAIITGGASGIGRTTDRLFVRDGGLIAGKKWADAGIARQGLTTDNDIGKGGKR